MSSIVIHIASGRAPVDNPLIDQVTSWLGHSTPALGCPNLRRIRTRLSRIGLNPEPAEVGLHSILSTYAVLLTPPVGLPCFKCGGYKLIKARIASIAAQQPARLLAVRPVFPRQRQRPACSSRTPSTGATSSAATSSANRISGLFANCTRFYRCYKSTWSRFGWCYEVLRHSRTFPEPEPWPTPNLPEPSLPEPLAVPNP